MSRPWGNSIHKNLQLAQQVMPYLGDVRASKATFELASVLRFVHQTVASTFAEDAKPTVSSWEAVNASISKLVQDAGKLLPLALEPENVSKGTTRIL